MSSNSTSSQQHEMHLAKTHPSGAQEWFCPMCSRRFLLHFHPERKKLDTLILEDGDVSVRHVRSKGELKVRISEISAIDDEPVLPEDLRTALDEALKDVNFDDW